MDKQLTNDMYQPPIPGYPGILALLGFYVLVQEDVEVAVIETGMGGERDSTNFIETPAATGITSIGLDHIGVLGNTLQDIAWHKAGIFKYGSPAYTVEQDAAVQDTLEQRSLEKQVAGKLEVVGEDCLVQHGVTVIPDAPYQRSNAALAIALCKAYLQGIDHTFSMTDDLLCDLHKTALPGKNEVIEEHSRTWLLSSAHNSMSMEVAFAWFRDFLQQPTFSKIPVVLLSSHKSGRDSEAILEVLCEAMSGHLDMFDEVVFCTNRTGIEDEHPDLTDLRENGQDDLETANRHAAKWLELTSQQALVLGSIKEAALHIQHRHKQAIIFVAGNLYLAGVVRFLLSANDIESS